MLVTCPEPEEGATGFTPIRKNVTCTIVGLAGNSGYSVSAKAVLADGSTSPASVPVNFSTTA